MILSLSKTDRHVLMMEPADSLVSLRGDALMHEI